ncbi:hypothetical protein [Marinimicrobium agarilyticum]|uniref:hypothetical protein n=1 Tax=Marinimicrobium agarilyticum TaxID=306546 RepID=UPI000485A855|nr:hypothetical protein [Marinimicrobium agarilyticum]
MMKKKDVLSPLLYCLALTAVASIQIYLLVIFFDYISAGLGVGVFAVYGYLLTLILASLVWLVSFWRKRNLLAAAVYCVAALAITPVLITQPVWWSAPPLQ